MSAIKNKLLDYCYYFVFLLFSETSRQTISTNEMKADNDNNYLFHFGFPLRELRERHTFFLCFYQKKNRF